MIKNTQTLKDCELILGNSNKRFSGVTSTMLQNFDYQKKIMPTFILGKHHVNDTQYVTSFWSLVFFCRGFVKGKWRIFHARRNNEVIQGFILKYIFRLKIKVVFTSTAQRHHSRFTRFLIKHCDGLLSTCQAAAFYLKRKPDAIIPHGIRTDIYRPVNAKATHTIKQRYGITTEQVCGIFGRVRAQKGVHLFVDACIEAFKNNTHTTAIIVGSIKPEDATFVDALKKKVADNGFEQRIIFLGEQPFEALPDLFSIMDVVCALSSKEGFGLTVLEAMSSGAAVIASHAGAWPEIIRQDIDGLLVDRNNPDTINQALSNLLNNPKKIEAMGAQGVTRIQSAYQITDEADALCTYFQALAHK